MFNLTKTLARLQAPRMSTTIFLTYWTAPHSVCIAFDGRRIAIQSQCTLFLVVQLDVFLNADDAGVFSAFCAFSAAIAT